MKTPAALIILVCVYAYADSPIVQYSGNGHLYQRIDAGLTWQEAQLYCSQLGGHLATITSPEEDAFVYLTLVSPDAGALLGGTDEGSEGNWRWVTGEPWTYSNWGDGEPNNYLENEHYLHYFDTHTFAWNDVPSLHFSFICEWSTPPQPFGYITYVEGDIHIAGLGDPPEPFDSILSFDAIEVGADSMLGMRAADGAIFLGENTDLNVMADPIARRTELELHKGILMKRVRKFKGHSLKVIMPQAIAGVRGTGFVIEATESETLITLMEGELDIRTPDESEQITLVGGQGVAVTMQGIGRPFPIDPEDVERWWPEQLIIAVASPVDLLVTDSLGRQIGTTATGNIVGEMPMAYYTGPDSEPEAIVINDPLPNVYDVGLTATDNGPFDLLIEAHRKYGILIEEQSGIVETGDVLNIQSNLFFVQNARIDVMPGKEPNMILLKGRGPVAVCVFNTSELDTTTIDPDTVVLGPNSTLPFSHSLKDLDRDGDLDLLVKFKKDELGLTAEDTELVLRGYTYSGHPVMGVDEISCSTSHEN